MQLLQLDIKELRALEHRSLDLSAAPGIPRRRVVLLGANGAGKTTLLDALAHAFQTLGSDTKEFGATPLQAGDIRNDKAPQLDAGPPRRAVIELQACLSPEEFRSIADIYPHAPTHGPLRFDLGAKRPEIRSALWDTTSSIDLSGETSFEAAARAALLKARPPCLLLPARRGVLDPHADVRVSEVLELNPRRDCLSRANRRFEALTARLALSFAGDKQADPAGTVNRMWKVLARYFPELPQPVALAGLSLQFENQKGAVLPLSALSDGERALLLMFGEIALRPPHHGLVMIDEVEQHLHPRWQRVVAEALAALVPTAQFILTTQSPYLAASVSDDVIELGDWGRDGR
jgi:ABC-type branched-subunit amino acid transport system ATPase component